MPRVLVCGCSGSGKSTFSLRLARKTGLEYIMLDTHFWQAGWTPRTGEAFRARLAPLIEQDSWIIDGSYFTALRNAHWKRATHIVFFDLPRWTCLLGVLKRTLGQWGRVRAGLPAGCPERFDREFLRYIWSYREKERPAVLALAETLRADQRLIHLTSRADAAHALAQLAHEGGA